MSRTRKMGIMGVLIGVLGVVTAGQARAQSCAERQVRAARIAAIIRSQKSARYQQLKLTSSPTSVYRNDDVHAMRSRWWKVPKSRMTGNDMKACISSGIAAAQLPPVQFRRVDQGNLVYLRCAFSSSASERMLWDQIFLRQMSYAVAAQCLGILGVPDDFTAKVGAAGALFPLTERIAWELHGGIRQQKARCGGRPVSFNITYRIDRGAIHAIYKILGGLGDRSLPFGEAANAIISIVNRAINALLR